MNVSKHAVLLANKIANIELANALLAEQVETMEAENANLRVALAEAVAKMPPAPSASEAKA